MLGRYLPGVSIIDVTASSAGISNQLKHWRVRDALAYSDHCSIEFVLKLDGIRPPLRRNFNAADWKSFEAQLDGKSLPAMTKEKWNKVTLDAEVAKL